MPNQWKVSKSHFLHRAAKKSSRKLTRAFSFSRTPRRVVQRAVTMLSPSQQLPPSGLQRADSTTSRDLAMEADDDQGEIPATGLTPSMSVTSLCTPQRDRRGNRLPSTSSLQVDSHGVASEQKGVRRKLRNLDASFRTAAASPVLKRKAAKFKAKVWSFAAFLKPNYIFLVLTEASTHSLSRMSYKKITPNHNLNPFLLETMYKVFVFIVLTIFFWP